MTSSPAATQLPKQAGTISNTDKREALWDVNGATHQAAAPCPSGFAEGRSYWIDQYPIDFETQNHEGSIPAEADVVIIGSGITAAACLYNLAERKPDLKVVVLEARGICTGATGRNGGHICRAEGTNFRGIVEAVGPEEGARLSKFGINNRNLMLGAIEKLEIADQVDLSLKGTRVVFASAEERQEYLEEVAAAKALGVVFEGRISEPDEVCAASSISPQIAQHGAATLDRSGTIYPRKLVAALLRYAMKRMPNLSIHSHTPVRAVKQLNSLSPDSRPTYTIHTDTATLTTRAVVHATNAYASYLLPSLAGTEGVAGYKSECIAVPPNVKPVSSINTPGLQGGLGYDEFWHWLIQRPNNGHIIYGWSGVEGSSDYDDSGVLPVPEPSATSDSPSSGEAASTETSATESSTIEEATPAKPEVFAGQNTMTAFLERAFPEQFRDLDMTTHPHYRWTGIQGFTKDRCSLVGRPKKDSPGEFMSVGHNGEGIGRCFACATVMTDWLVWWLDGKADKEWECPEWFPRSFLYDVEGV